ncbi:MAG: Wzz/FepE/Etk N-terminal domain-containing protein [Chloroflexota bacterium]|nr:Wzz/FepE/Etk N-terminal domain-containing protein [Chloroflexota bacterium]
MGYELDLRESLGVLRRRWWVVVLAAASAVVVAYGYARLQQPTYRSSIRLEVAARFDNGQQLALERQLPQLAQRVRTTDVTREVDNRLRLDLGAGAILDRLRAEAQTQNGQILIEADDVDPRRVESIVLETARVFEEQHAARNQGIATQERTVVSILDRPTPARLVWPNTRVVVAAAGVLGLLVGTLLAFLIDYLDDTLKTAEDIERALGTVTLGRIPRGAGLLTPSDAIAAPSPVTRALERTG